MTTVKSGAPRAKAHGSSTCFVGRNPPKHTLLRSLGASKGTLLAFIHGLKTRACAPKYTSARRRGFLRRRAISRQALVLAFTYKVRKLFTIRTIYYRLKESIRVCKKPRPFNLGFCSFDLMLTERKLSALPFYVAL